MDWRRRGVGWREVGWEQEIHCVGLCRVRSGDVIDSRVVAAALSLVEYEEVNMRIVKISLVCSCAAM